MAWHEPRPIAELPDDYRGDVLVYNPCDGWHLLWTADFSVEYLKGCGMFVAWMPEPPEPNCYDYDKWKRAHEYVPDYMAMGDCRVCGHVKSDEIHCKGK